MAVVSVQAQIDIINQIRVGITDMTGAIDRLKALQTRWGYLNMTADFRKANMAGTPHEGLTEVQVSEALAAVTALVALLDSGEGAKLYRLLWPIR